VQIPQGLTYYKSAAWGLHEDFKSIGPEFGLIPFYEQFYYFQFVFS
jgi:hypothetical protein